MNAGPKETRDRMSRMRRMIFRRNVYDWAKAFLAALQLTQPSLERTALADTMKPEAP